MKQSEQSLNNKVKGQLKNSMPSLLKKLKRNKYKKNSMICLNNEKSSGVYLLIISKDKSCQ
jgi:hypothetical protein